MIDDIRAAYIRERLEAASEDAAKLVKDVVTHSSLSGNEDEAFYEVSALQVPFLDTYLGKTKLGGLFEGEDRDEEYSAVQACDHVSFDHPSVMFVPLANTKFFACSECVTFFQNEWYEEHSDDCDACGESADVFYEVSMPLGPLVIVGNICKTCLVLHRISSGFLGEPEL